MKSTKSTAGDCRQAAAALAALGALLLTGCDRIESMASDANSERSATVQIGDRLLRIPVRFMYAEGLELHGRWPSPKEGVVKVGAVGLSVLLPDLRPYSDADKASWRKQGHGDRVEVSIAAFPGVDAHWVRELRNRERSSSTSKEIALDEGVEGLERFEQATSDLYFPRGLDPPLVIDCPKASGLRFPSCRVRSVLSPGVELRYTYSVGHLPSWKTVDEGLRRLVERFAADARRNARIDRGGARTQETVCTIALAT